MHQIAKYTGMFMTVASIMACGESGVEQSLPPEEPVAEIPAANAGPEARRIAEKVIEAMGGREAWHQTRHIAWSFFGNRHLLWDKMNDRARIEHHKKDLLFLLNCRDTTGRVFHNGREITHPDSLKEMVRYGHQIWVNDSYWLVMPFKMLDPGVTLTYKGKVILEDSTHAEQLEMTFDNGTGYTPENRYLVYVDPVTNLVCRWDFFANNTMTEPSMSNNWNDYRKYGSILLSGSRGDRSLTDIGVFDELPERAYTDTASVAEMLRTPNPQL